MSGDNRNGQLPVTWTRVDRRHRQAAGSPMENSAGDVAERLRVWDEDGFVTRWPEPTRASIRSYDQLVAHYGAEEVARWLARYDADHEALAAIRGSLRAALDRNAGNGSPAVTCERCGEPARPGARYCSTACRVAAHRSRVGA
jgi:hypothetical protein